MIICDLNLVGVTVPPSEANPPLIVNTNAELTFTVAFQLLQPVAWRDTKIL